MTKLDELTKLDSCLNKAQTLELIFVILQRDKAAPDTIRYWAKKRIRLGKNKPTDPQIVEARQWAKRVEKSWARETRKP